MPSKLQIETARINGAKSQGPSTSAGRAASSRNSLRHGLRAKSIVLPQESNRQYKRLFNDYVEEFHPQGRLQLELVQTMAIARWRLMRVLRIETDLLDNELTDRADFFDEHRSQMDKDGRVAFVFASLANHGKSLSLVLRYEGSLNRSYDSAFRQLRQLQAARPLQPNEPKVSDDPAPQPESKADDSLSVANLMKIRGKQNEEDCGRRNVAASNHCHARHRAAFRGHSDRYQRREGDFVGFPVIKISLRQHWARLTRALKVVLPQI